MTAKHRRKSLDDDVLLQLGDIMITKFSQGRQKDAVSLLRVNVDCEEFDDCNEQDSAGKVQLL